MTRASDLFCCSAALIDLFLFYFIFKLSQVPVPIFECFNHLAKQKRKIFLFICASYVKSLLFIVKLRTIFTVKIFFLKVIFI
jgi:hypothetical protein